MQPRAFCSAEGQPKSSRLNPLLHKTDDATPHSSNRKPPMLDMRQVTKVYRTELVETHALRSLDLHVKEGEFVAVTGPSGSGKTTFLNIRSEELSVGKEGVRQFRCGSGA